jgi:hypothetical protein
MGKQCAKCHYVQPEGPHEYSPECPKCEALYANVEASRVQAAVPKIQLDRAPRATRIAVSATNEATRRPSRHLSRALIVGAAILGLAIWAANYFFAQRYLSDVIAADARNSGISASAHYEYYVSPSSLVFDLRSISSNTSMADVTRVLLQFAASRKNESYERVILSYRGEPRFVFMGDYFHTLGAEYGSQNPVYTMRTLPENVFHIDGKQAFGSWTGGWLGVVSKQMEDFTEFHKQWYLSEVARALRP